MGTATLNRTVNLKVMECGTCGIAFALPQSLYDHCYNEGGYWTCPLGHSRGWDKGNKKAYARELEEKVAQLESKIDIEKNRVQSAQREAAAARGQVTKIKNRVGKGICPCCNRSFQNLRRHMTTQHPDYSKEAV
jgi:transcription elongation factor Elf1